MARINGKEYEYSKITVIAAGRDILGIRGLNYGSSMEKEHLYGKGNKPLSIQGGNIKYEGDISLTQSEYLGLKALGGGTILDLQIDIVVCYGRLGQVLTTETLYGVEFTEEKMEWSQGDKYATVKLPFLYLDQE